METHLMESGSTNDSHNLFTRTSMLENSSKIRLVDTDEETGLALFCYNHCSNEESDFIKQCRGLVFHGETLVMKAFSYTSEYTHSQKDLVKPLLGDMSKWTFTTAYEGALLRMFYFSGRWFLSTHRKLNAFRSKWGSHESFGSMFKTALEDEAKNYESFSKFLGQGENVLDRFQASLDKTKQYMFLLRNFADNRIVCDPPVEGEHLVFHVGTFSNGKLVDDNIGLSSPEKHTFSNLDELIDYVKTQVDPRKRQGVMCLGPNLEQIKILHDKYKSLFSVRGNEPSLKFRYLQVRMDRELTDALYNLYPEMREVFTDYEKTIYDIATVIHRAYVQRFISRNYVTVPKEEYQVITECHSWHLADRKNNIVNLKRVIQVLNKQPATNLNHMIRRYKIEKATKENTLPRTVRGSRNNSTTNSPALRSMPEPPVLLRV